MPVPCLLVLRWTRPEEVPAGFRPSVASVGVFDGVHRGHQQDIDRAVRWAREIGGRCAVVTFDPNPLAVLRPEAAPPALLPLERRLRLFAEQGADAALVLPFTRELAAEPPELFVDQVLAGALGVRGVVVGENFRFGARAAGDPELLTTLGRSRGFDVVVMPLAGDEGEIWSSTAVRGHLEAGEVERAAAILGRPHRVDGVVVVGDRRGRELGYPTANLLPPPGIALPADGIYAGRLVVLGQARDHAQSGAGSDPLDGSRAATPPGLPAAVSVGTNPTFGGVGRRVEAYVLDRDDLDLYGRLVGVEFHARIRDSVRFESVRDLLAAMDRDVAVTRAVLAEAGSG